MNASAVRSLKQITGSSHLREIAIIYRSSAYSLQYAHGFTKSLLFILLIIARFTKR